MKFVPRRNQIVGRSVIKRVLKTIVRLDDNKNTTKFILVDAVGPGAAAAGLKVGDIVLPHKVNTIMLDGGVRVIFLLEEEHVAIVVTGLPREELEVQNTNGTQFVSFDDPDAAQPIGENPHATNGRTIDHAVAEGAPV